jgi:uncharacterized protein (TIGR01244 family)
MSARRLGAYVSVVAVTALLVLECGATAKTRPAHWATPLATSELRNAFAVEPNLLRSAQPDADGFKELERLGIKTVLNLRHDYDDVAGASRASLTFVKVPMRAWKFREDEVLEALRVPLDPANRPILVHCKRGADRTGGVIAMYRVVVQGWTKDEALREMKKGGFGYYPVWRSINSRILNVDVERVRRELGIAAPSAPGPP